MRAPLLLIGLLNVLLLGAGWNQLQPPTDLVLTEESRVWVEGTSTIHDWRCEAEQFVGVLSVDASADRAQPLAGVPKAEITIAAKQLECGSGKMNKKAHGALAVDEHSFIRYTLESSEVRTAGTDGWIELNTTGRLEIAGTERSVEMTVQAKPLADGQFQFKGSLPLRMTDYNVDPPTALLGTLKTGDEVVVHFDVVVGSGTT